MRFAAPMVVAALLLTGCGGTPTAEDDGVLPAVEVTAPAPLVDAVRATQAEGSAEARFGYLDENQIGRTTISGTSLATLDGRTASAEFAVEILGQSSEGRMRIVDGVRYVSTVDEERWTRNEPDDVAQTDEVAARLQDLLTLDVELEEQGTETIEDVSTTRFVFELDDTETDGVVVRDREGAVWIDDDGRIRQFQLTRVRETGGVTAVVSDLVTFTSFGVEVDVEAPPSDLIDPSGSA